jgi:hypothetical protein
MYLTLIKFRYIGNQMNLKNEIALQLMPDGIRCGILKRLKKRLFLFFWQEIKEGCYYYY